MLRRGNESNVKGLFIVGDLAGAPVIKLAMAQAVEVVEYIASLPDMRSRNRADKSDPGLLDVLIIGAGAAGLNAALACKDMGFSYVVLEKGKIANTIENFPEGKWVYAEPDDRPPKGKLWLDGARKEDLVERWRAIVSDNDMDVRSEEPLVGLDKQQDGTFIAKSSKDEFRARKIILATGQRGNPRKLGADGEDREQVYHRLYSPRRYRDENIIVVGGGNSAVEAALVLSEQNNVVVVHRSEEFSRVFADNRDKLEAAIASGRIQTYLSAGVTEFGDGEAVVATRDGGESPIRIPYDHAFVLVGAELPSRFLNSLGVKLENEWEGSLLRSGLLAAATLLGLWLLGPAITSAEDSAIWRIPPWIGGIAAFAAASALAAFAFRSDNWARLALGFVVCYSIYGIKMGAGAEFWPYRNWGHGLLSIFDRPWSFWYTVLYTVVMTIFGVKAMKRWGLDRRDRFQIWRYVSLLSFQWLLFFIVPEFLFQWAIKYQWVGETLATDPQFADQAWRSYGIVYAWPLFFYTFFYDPHIIWVVWGALLTFLIIPILVLFSGKRYCSWICGCGGLAETLGDRWRHLAPKGKTAVAWEKMSYVIFAAAILVTVLVLAKDVAALLRGPADWSLQTYKVAVDVWLVGILPVTLYPFMGGKVWCRYWCPLAKFMELLSRVYTKLGLSRFHIVANDKCIGCNECSRNCQVGIDVMRYALKQETLDNATSSCIGCGICVSVCPMDTLSFSKDGKVSLPILAESEVHS